MIFILGDDPLVVSVMLLSLSIVLPLSIFQPEFKFESDVPWMFNSSLYACLIDMSKQQIEVHREWTGLMDMRRGHNVKVSQRSFLPFLFASMNASAVI